MRSKAFAILLIVLGVAATIGGVYGQLFLGEDEGHHDEREPTFAAQSQAGAYALTASGGDGQLLVSLTQAGQSIQAFDELHGEDGAHVFIVDGSGTFFSHAVVASLDETPFDVVGDGPHRVVVQAAPGSGPDLLELGVSVDGASAAVEPNSADRPVVATDAPWTDGGLTVTRQGFDFVLSEAWNGDDLYDGPALLTLFRLDDGAFTHAHGELVGNNRFSFATDLPGLGDYLAALEFEQDGDTVTALFRFTL